MTEKKPIDTEKVNFIVNILRGSVSSFFRWYYIRPKQSEVRENLKRDFGDAFVRTRVLRLKLGSDVSYIDDTKYLVYIPYYELLRVSDETEANIYHELYRINSSELLELTEPQFFQAYVALQTFKSISKQPTGEHSAEKYYFKIRNHNKENVYLETIRVMESRGILKETLQNLKKEYEKIPEDEKCFNPILEKKLQKIIREGHAKALKIVKEECKKINDMSVEELIKKANSAKNPEEKDYRYNAEQVVHAVIKEKPLKCGRYNVSYYALANIIYKNPGQTVTELENVLSRKRQIIYWAIAALMSPELNNHKNGMGLILIRKEGRTIKLYPSQKFSDIAKEYIEKK